MGLVDYDSDSGSSEAEQTAAAPKVAVPSTTATAGASGKKQPFQKLVDRANPGKIVVSLPSTVAGEDAEAEDNERPAKRARVGAVGSSRFSSFGSFLPPPKKTAATTKSTAGGGELPGTARQSVNLKTSSEAAFSRQRAQATADGSDGSSSCSTKMTLPPAKAPSIPEGQKAASDVKLVGNPLMFMPLSVSRKPGGKKKTGGKGKGAAAGEAASKAGAARTEEVPAPPKKKVSLFSLEANAEDEAAADGEGEEVPSADGTYQPLFETYEREGQEEQPLQLQQQQQQQQQLSGSLDALADDLRLTARERRELFGRAGAGAAVASATFNMDEEYRHNEKVRLASEADQKQQAHNPVRAVQPGKHSLRQLVTAVQTQQDALEETFAKNRAAQRESGSRAPHKQSTTTSFSTDEPRLVCDSTMSVLQIEDLVSYQLRASYLSEFADGVGERLITLDESIVHSAPFKAAGWRPNPGLIKRTHSPPIPTAVASEYFRAPRTLGLTLEDEPDNSSGLLGGGPGGGGFGGGIGGIGSGGVSGQIGGSSSLMLGGGGGSGGAGGSSSVAGGSSITAATKRRRRREQMEEEEDSSDLSDESDDEGTAEQRAAQQIKFAKMPTRFRSGSSPLQSSNLRQPPMGPPDSPTSSTTTTAGAGPGAGARRGSQSALEAVKERARRDTVTSSEMSSENEFDASGFQRLREQGDVGGGSSSSGRSGRTTTTTTTAQGRSRGGNNSSSRTAAAAMVKRQDSDLLEEEQEDEEDEEDEEGSEDESEGEDGLDGLDGDDGSDMSSTFAGSIESASASMLHAGTTNPLNAPPLRLPIIGTPPREFTRTATVRRSQRPVALLPMGELPPPRPLSTLRPASLAAPPRSLLSAALQAKKSGAAMPFDRFATLSGKGDPNPIMVRIYAPFSAQSTRPFEVPIRRLVQEGGGGAERTVTVADLIGLSLWRYTEEKREPALPANRLHVNWWTLRMVEEGGEVDDDFPPLERTRPLASFTTANNSSSGGGNMSSGGGGGGGGRFRANSKVYDDFALVEASASEFNENQRTTPQFTAEKVGEMGEQIGGRPNEISPRKETDKEADNDGDRTPRNATPQPGAGRMLMGGRSSFQPLDQPRANPIITTMFRFHGPHADDPAVPAATPNTARGRKKLLRVHVHVANMPPGQMVALEVATDTYLEQVLDMVCKKRQLDKASHVLKLPDSGAVVLMDRTVASIGALTDLDLYRKRFADGSATGSLASSSAAAGAVGSVMGVASGAAAAAAAAASAAVAAAGASPKLIHSGYGYGSSSTNGRHRGVVHPLARELIEASDASYKKYTVWRRQGLKLMGSSERVVTIDGEYVHIGGASTGKVTTVHFSNVVGCKVSHRHPTHFKLIVYKATESKRYDFLAKTADEAAEIVLELKKAMSPYRDV
ncbi:stress activated map kinase interacting [Grosmannia clavigera kw1407]|uniref:Stress activated map kinase interacting n=1 Tax=Grosmannia clavigera (strain kw1407 / UAMH 11150) TaxID=655863 RepID=F0XNJ0_GROCL|nr:stress activated map kinase interacting [Grosmannia clavigera kw1407]EFX00644.1 stress activated map kinase interacting [Grosmannia clavigera kw1407]